MVLLTKKRKVFGIAELILAFIVMLLIIIIGNRYLAQFRVDMTENNIYTLSQGTRNILSSINEPITLRYYYSSKLSKQTPGMDVYASRVSDLLDEYQRLGGDNLILKQIDPEPFTEQEDEAVSHGLNGIAVDQGGSKFYFGLVGTNSIDGKEIIAFFNPERELQLEYDVSRLISRLATIDEKKVAVLSAIETSSANPQATALAQHSSQPWYALQQLSELYEVEYLDKEIESIETNISVVVVIHPSGLSDNTLLAVEQYALNGGKLILFLDPFSEASQPSDQLNKMVGEGSQSVSVLKKLLTNWGVDIDASKVVIDLDNALRVQANNYGVVEVIDYPVWFMLGEENMNQDDPVFQGLGRVVLASVGVLTSINDAATEFTPLMSTSSSANVIDTNELQIRSNPKQILKKYTPGDQVKVVAARITGEVKRISHSQNNEIPQDESSNENEASAQSLNDTPDSAMINMVLFADTDLLRDQYWVQVQNFLGQRVVIPNAENGKLIANLVDQMSGSEDLISVRNTGSTNRPFTMLENIRQRAEQRFLSKEQELQSELADAESKLVALENTKNKSDGVFLSADQQREINKFTQKKLQIRKDLRDVRHSLQVDIERVQLWIKLFNIVLIPALIILLGLFYMSIRPILSRRR